MGSGTHCPKVYGFPGTHGTQANEPNGLGKYVIIITAFLYPNDRLLVLILIRKSIRSMKNHLEKMSSRLPYHFDDDEMSNHSATSPQINAKDTTMDTMVGHQTPDAEVVL